MNDEEYQEFLEIGFIPISHKAFLDACGSCKTNEQAEEALVPFLKERGLDMTKPIQVRGCFDKKVYLLRQHATGHILTLEDLPTVSAFIRRNNQQGH